MSSVDAAQAAFLKLSPVQLKDIAISSGPNGLVQRSPDFKDAVMVSISILLLAAGIPLMISTSIAIASYNNYVESKAGTAEDDQQFSSLNNGQIILLSLIALPAIIAGVVLLGMNLQRRHTARMTLAQALAKTISSASTRTA